MNEQAQTAKAVVAPDADERDLLRQVLSKALELVNSGDAGSYELAKRMVLNFAKSTQLPAVDATPVTRRYLVLEVRGGDEVTARSWYGLAELDLEHLVNFLQALLEDLPPRVRKNPPELVLHRPTAVEA